MDTLYEINDHVRYWYYLAGETTAVQGRVTGFEDTGHKTMCYRIKRDQSMQGNLGIWQSDVVSPINIIGLV